MAPHEPTPEVRKAHRRLAEALEAYRAIAPAAVLAQHWLEAGDPVGFARWAVPAAREAGRGERHEEQADFLRQLLGLWDEPGAAAAVGRPLPPPMPFARFARLPTTRTLHACRPWPGGPRSTTRAAPRARR